MPKKRAHFFLPDDWQRRLADAAAAIGIEVSELDPIQPRDVRYRKHGCRPARTPGVSGLRTGGPLCEHDDFALDGLGRAVCQSCGRMLCDHCWRAAVVVTADGWALCGEHEAGGSEATKP